MRSVNLYILVRQYPQIQIDKEDLDILGKYMASLCGGYVRVWLRKTAVFLHTLIVVAPDGYEIDHGDTDGLNNRRSNLRIATRSQNNYNQNLRQDNSTGHKGVHYYKATNKYQAYIDVKKQRISLGYFDTYEAACNAYDRRARIYAQQFQRNA